MNFKDYIAKPTRPSTVKLGREEDYPSEEPEEESDDDGDYYGDPVLEVEDPLAAKPVPVDDKPKPSALDAIFGDSE